MDMLRAGFCRVDITPMLGIALAGYLERREADGILDRLEINALALACGGQKALLLSVDNLGIGRLLADEYREHISEVTGVPDEAVFLSATHTHTAPRLKYRSEDPLEQEYCQTVFRKAADAAQMALADLKPARMGYGTVRAPDIAFIRRFRMKDGSVLTNPGVGNPDILCPLGEADRQVSVLRFDQEGGNHLILVGFGVHPDTVGGCKISADFPGFLRGTLEKTVEHTRCMFFNGAEGDVNHIKVRPEGGDMNGLQIGFDGPRGYEHTRYMGRALAGAVLQIYDKVQYVEVNRLCAGQRVVEVPSNMPRPEEMAEARKLAALYDAGDLDHIPYQGMLRTTMVASAKRKIRLEHGPASFPMRISAIAVGKVALVGFPGEPFTGIGTAMRRTEGWDLVMTCCQTNGAQGYFPMQEAYDEGGYEAGNSSFRAGVAELMIREGKRLLAELR